MLNVVLEIYLKKKLKNFFFNMAIYGQFLYGNFLYDNFYVATYMAIYMAIFFRYGNISLIFYMAIYDQF